MKISVPPRVGMAAPQVGTSMPVTAQAPARPVPQDGRASQETQGQNREGPHLALLGLLRQFRAEVQNLESSLLEVREKGNIEDPQVRALELAAALALARELFQSNGPQIELVLDEIRALLESRPELLDWCSDEFTRLENQWERALYHWPGEGLPEHETCLKVERVLKRFDKIFYLCGLLTVPDRVRGHLGSLRVGQGLDFKVYFEDEFSRDEKRNRVARSRLLRYLSDHPNVVEGVVDQVSGVVFRASNKLRRRLLSYGLELGLVLLGFGLAFLLSRLGGWLNLEDWPFAPDSSRKMMAAYGFLVAGAFCHGLVDSLKQTRKDDGTGLLALRDWFLWLHVREMPIIGAILSLWVGLLGLAFVVGSMAWSTAFFVGYSIDSFMDLFLDRFTQAVTAKTGAIRKQVTPGGSP